MILHAFDGEGQNPYELIGVLTMMIRIPMSVYVFNLISKMTSISVNYDVHGPTTHPNISDP